MWNYIYQSFSMATLDATAPSLLKPPNTITQVSKTFSMTCVCRARGESKRKRIQAAEAATFRFCVRRAPLSTGTTWRLVALFRHLNISHTEKSVISVHIVTHKAPKEHSRRGWTSLFMSGPGIDPVTFECRGARPIPTSM